jgi:hypothetical protein
MCNFRDCESTAVVDNCITGVVKSSEKRDSVNARGRLTTPVC